MDLLSVCSSGSYRPCPLGPPQVPSSCLHLGRQLGPHLLCSSFPACAPRDSQLNVRGRQPGAASQRCACRRRPAGAACGLTSAWLDAKAAALLSLSRVRVSPQLNSAPFAEGHPLDRAPITASPRESRTVAVHPTVGSSLVSQVRASCPRHVLSQTHRGPFFWGPRGSSGSSPRRHPDSGCQEGQAVFLAPAPPPGPCVTCCALTRLWTG